MSLGRSVQRFQGFELDRAAHELRRRGRPVRLEGRAMSLLMLLLERPGDLVTRAEIVARLWGTDAFVDVESGINTAVRKLRMALRDNAEDPKIVRTVQGMGYRFIAPLETEAENGRQPEADAVAPGIDPPVRSPRRALIAGVAAAVVAVVVALSVGWWLVREAEPATAQNGRVEVVAFQPGAKDPELRRVATEASDTLISVLSRSGVTIATRQDGSAGAGRDAELRVEGVVGRTGPDYAFDVRIIDGRSGFVLWTDRILRSLQEIRQSPGEPAAAIGGVIDCAVEDRRGSKTPVSSEAFSLYLYTCAGVFLSSDEGRRILAVTRRLVKAAPRFANAHAMHAMAAGRIASSTQAPELAAALHREAKAAAETALRLDPRTAKAYCGLALNEGVLADRLEHNWALEEGYLKKALALDPNLAPARNEYATLLASTGRIREAIEFIRGSRASENSRLPRDPRPALLLAAQGDLVAARDYLAQAEARDRVSRDDVRRIIVFWWEDPKAALVKLPALGGEKIPAYRGCFTPYLERLVAHKPGLPPGCKDVNPATRIRLLARQGDIDGALAAMKGPIPGGPALLYYPEMRALRADPRFWRLAASTGLAGYWRSSGRWPDFCAEPGQDCRRAAALALGARG